MKTYTREQILIAAELGETNMIDWKFTVRKEENGTRIWRIK